MSATAALLVLLVVAYGVGVMAGREPLRTVDAATLHYMLDHRDTTVSSIVVVITAMFGPVWVATMTITAAGMVYVADRTLVRPVILLATVAAAGASCELLKLLVHRTRPPTIDQITTVETVNSYPSGHVTGTAALLLVLAVLLTRTPVTRSIAFAGALVITAAVAATRVYMAAHWLTDVSAAVALAGAAVLTVPMAVRGALVRFPSAASGIARPRHPAPARPEIR